MNRLKPVIDMSYGDQEVLQRILAEPGRIDGALAPADAREHARIVDVLEALADALAPEFFKQHEYDDPEHEQTQQDDRGMSR